ncbi:MAG: 4-(cytidine 5'-diphospho)-2-C-methyl-D-erythritol kinase [Solirubrobacteraceae bacterium]
MNVSESFPTLVAKAPAKVNLGLFVGPTRPDGRHELATVMQSISLCDELTLSPSAADADELSCPGVSGPAEENLALRALRDFREATGWERPSARIEVVKRVPVAAGLGGGSGDAAAVLRLAAAASGLCERAPLLELARGLGADVPAQVHPGRWLAQGVGERLRALPAPAPFGVLVLPFDAGLSTAAVYRELDRAGAPRSAEALAELAGELLRALGDGAELPAAELLHNDLQAPALELEPRIGAALEAAARAGADRVLLSGSGPTALGLFAGPDGLDRARLAAASLRGLRRAFAAAPVQASFGAVAEGATRAGEDASRGADSTARAGDPASRGEAR